MVIAARPLGVDLRVAFFTPVELEREVCAFPRQTYIDFRYTEFDDDGKDDGRDVSDCGPWRPSSVAFSRKTSIGQKEECRCSGGGFCNGTIRFLLGISARDLLSVYEIGNAVCETN